MEQQTAKRAAEPVALHAHAMDNLRFIRETMERSGSFTAVPGWGGVLMGLTALGAAYIAAQQPTNERWMAVWLIEAAVAFAVGFATIRQKARISAVPLMRGPARKFALGMLPSVAAGAILTVVLFAEDKVELLAGMWMLLYGVAVLAAGAFSVRAVPAMGLYLMAIGTAALFIPYTYAGILLALGFGGGHILFGAIIARRYGG